MIEKHEKKNSHRQFKTDDKRATAANTEKNVTFFSGERKRFQLEEKLDATEKDDEILFPRFSFKVFCQSENELVRVPLFDTASARLKNKINPEKSSQDKEKR